MAKRKGKRQPPKEWDNELHEAYWNYATEVIIPNMRERIVMYDGLRRSPQLVAVQRELCRRDIIHFFRYYAWTHEPRPLYLKWYGLPEANIPFILYPKQEELVREICSAIDSGQDLLIDKTRAVGASWMMTTIFLWYWMKRESGNNFLIGSRKFDSVDRKGAEDTLFEKLRYNLYRISFFWPEGFNPDKHDHVGFIQNPANGNYCRGEANNPNFATSGRYKAIFADEFAKWEESDEAAWTSMGSSSLCRIAISTPYGMGKKFSKLRFSDSIRTLEFHWTDHPLYGYKKYQIEQHPYLPDKKNVWVSPWYLMECERRKNNPEADIGQELDMDHLSSGLPYFRNQLPYIQRRYKELEAIRDREGWKRYEFQRTSENTIDLYPTASGRLVVREEPVHGWRYRYGISCDVAEGLEHGDNTVFYVFDRVTLEDVAWFIGKVDTHVLALLLSYVGFWFNEAFIAVERNNQGGHVLQELKKIYTNLMHKQDFTRVVDLDRAELGWHTNVSTKPIMCGLLRQAMAEEVEGCHDLGFFGECVAFVTHPKTGKLGAEAGNHDDRVIAQAIKLKLHEWLPAPQKITHTVDPHAGKIPFGIEIVKEHDIRNIWN